MGDVGRLIFAILGVIVSMVGAAGMVGVFLGRPPRPTAAAWEMFFWYCVVIAVGGLVLLVATRV